MKIRKNRIKFLSIIAFILSIGPISWMVYGNEDRDITYSIQEKISEDGTETTIMLEVRQGKKVTEISSVVLPDDSVIEKQTSIAYKVKENGKYNFIVRYKIQEGTEIQELMGTNEEKIQETKELEKEEEIFYEVDSILEKQIESEEENTEESIPVIEEPNKEPETYAGEIVINQSTFPDANFRNWLKNSNNINGYGADGILSTGEIDDIKEINVGNQNISDLTGINIFKSLTTLDCSRNKLTSLNINSNRYLENLNCSNNQITSLNNLEDSNSNLIEIDCHSNKLSFLKVNRLSKLRRLDCSYNDINDIYTDYVNMSYINCSNNQIDTLSLSYNTSLTELNVANNQLSHLDLSSNTLLTTLDVSDNQFTTLNLSRNTALSTFNGNNQKVTVTMSYTGSGYLSDKTYQINSLSNSNVVYNMSHEKFVSNSSYDRLGDFTTSCFYGGGKRAVISGKITFEYFTPVTDIVFRSNIEITTGEKERLYGEFIPNVATNNIIEWSVKDAGSTGATIENSVLNTTASGTVVITAIIKDGIKNGDFVKEFTIKVVDPIYINEKNFPDEAFRNWLKNENNINGYGKDEKFTKNEITNIKTINVSNQSIYDLTGIRNFTSLKSLDCSSNRLTELNVKFLNDLTTLNCSSNQLTILYADYNSALKTLNCSNNLLNDLYINNSSELVSLQCSNNNLLKLELSIHPKLTILHCSNNAIRDLDISSVKSLKTLDCSDNQITTLTIDRSATGNRDALEEIDCSNNLLMNYLNVEYLNNLQTLNCSSNQLTGLYADRNLALQTLNCSNNLLTAEKSEFSRALISLDFSRNQITYIDLSLFNVLKTVKAENQQINAQMLFINNMWQSNNMYTITSLSISRFQYDSQTKLITVHSSDYANPQFTSECPSIGGNGQKLIITGTFNFLYIDPSTGFVPVANISNVPTSMLAGEKISLGGTVAPSNATAKKITWLIKDKGTTNASLDSNNRLTAKFSGKIVVAAIVEAGVSNGNDRYTQDFEINVSYGNPDSLNCTYSTISGKNGWYISDFIVQPPSGYQIANTLGGIYNDMLIYNASTTPVVYLKNVSNGVLYSGKTLTAIKIDKSDPIITGILNEGSEVNASKTVNITDTNLSSVLFYTADSALELNTALGISQTITSGKCTITLTAGNKDQYFKIVAEDQAGRKTTYTYSLLAPIYKVEVADLIFETVDYGYTQVEQKKLTINVDKGNTTATISGILSSDTSKFTVSGSGTNWIVKPTIGLKVGEHRVTLTTVYNGGKTTISTVVITVKEMTNPEVLLQIPSNIKLEKVRNDERFEAVKEEKISILESTDTNVFGENFYITTEPKFYLLNTANSDEYFLAQLYDGNDEKYASKGTPLAILNGTTKEQSFYIKAYKDIARKQGVYEGIMNFEIRYGEAR